MAGPASIVVRRLLLNVDMHGTERDAVAVQRWLPRMCSDVLVPAIEAALRHVDPGETSLTLDRLAVEVAVPSLDGLATVFPEAARQAVAEQIGPTLLASAGSAAGAGAEENVRWRRPAETVAEALLEFLGTGRLPWSFRIPAGARLEDGVIAAWSDSGPAPTSRDRLRTALAAPHIRARVVKQFTPAFVMLLLRSVSPEQAVATEDVLRRLDAAGASTLTRRLWDVALAAAATDRPVGASALVRAAWTASTPDPDLAAALEHHWPGATERRDERSTREDIGDLPRRPAPERQTDREADAGGILVDHAGVVLLHPFLSRFLTGLGVADGDELLDPDRAVCLIHHLATGEPTAPEHQLTLAKVLCGLSLDEPVEADVGLTGAEIEEATALLDAAIGHWEALRNTSPDGLRGEFLTRPGTLSVDVDGGWLLRVETRAADILLDQLPWGVSMVRLLWMRRLLRVEWR
ncbi:contractile injection system tape measure protein [Pseudonocardia sp. DLS-67]